MPVAFTVASWNVEHFGRGSGSSATDPARLNRVSDFVEDVEPDVFAIYEVESRVIFEALRIRFPNYSFHITEGKGSQEILVAASNDFGSFFTQRLEFTSGSLVGLRPGALLTITHQGVHYPMLFLHTKSINDPRGFGLRSYQLDKAFNLKKTLDKVAVELGQGPMANYMFLGDLNSMGMNLTYSDRDVTGGQEIDRLRRYASGRGMKLLSKTKPHTFWNGPNGSIPKSNLDHVVAAEHLKFQSFGGNEVKIRGWPEKPTDSSAGTWISQYSDHALLYFKVLEPT